jgi:hypothetical protein
LRAEGNTPEQVTGWLAWSCGLLPAPTDTKARDLLSEFALQRISPNPTILSRLGIP